MSCRGPAGEFVLRDRVAESCVDQALVHCGSIGFVEGFPDRLHRSLDCSRRFRGHSCGDLVCACPELFARSDFGDESDAEGGVGPHTFVVAHECDSQSLGEAYPAHQPDGFEGTDQAGRDVRIEERRVLGADHHIGFVDEIQCARRAHSLDRAHHGLPHLLPLGAQKLAGILVVPDVVGLTVGGFDVEAGAEGAVACGTKHHRVHPLVVFDDVPGIPYLVAHRPIERVQPLRPIQSDRGDVVVGIDVEEDRLESRRWCHCGSPVLAHVDCRSAAAELRFGPLLERAQTLFEIVGTTS